MLFENALLNDGIATLITLGLAVGWLRLIDALAARKLLVETLSRKLVHIGTGPLFVLCWVLFSDLQTARYWAALVPGLITLQFLFVGLGIINDPDAVQALSRSGDRREILRGPLIYGIAFIIATIVWWRSAPIGMAALMLLCGGDGFADVIGRNFGTRKLPINSDKSWAGSAAMLVAGFGFAFVYVWLFNSWGYFAPAYSTGTILSGTAILAIVGAVVEALPFGDFDNLTVTIATIVVGLLVF